MMQNVLFWLSLVGFLLFSSCVIGFLAVEPAKKSRSWYALVILSSFGMAIYFFTTFFMHSYIINALEKLRNKKNQMQTQMKTFNNNMDNNDNYGDNSLF